MEAPIAKYYWQRQLELAQKAVEVATLELAKLALVGVERSESSLD